MAMNATLGHVPFLSSIERVLPYHNSTVVGATVGTKSAAMYEIQ